MMNCSLAAEGRETFKGVYLPHLNEFQQGPIR